MTKASISLGIAFGSSVMLIYSMDDPFDRDRQDGKAQDALDKLAAMEKQTRNVGRPSYMVFWFHPAYPAIAICVLLPQC